MTSRTLNRQPLPSGRSHLQATYTFERAAANLRNPSRKVMYIFPSIFIIKMYIYVCFRHSLAAWLYIHILLPHPCPVGASPSRVVGLAVYVRKGCFIMRAERGGHISLVHTLSPSLLPRRHAVFLRDRRDRVLCRKNSSGAVFSLSSAVTNRHKEGRL